MEKQTFVIAIVTVSLILAGLLFVNVFSPAKEPTTPNTASDTSMDTTDTDSNTVPAVDTIPNTNVTYYEGIISTGGDLGRDYCSEGVYFTTQGEAYLLRSDTPDNELVQSTQIEMGLIYLPLRFPDPRIKYCEVLTCDCERSAVLLSE